MQYMLLIFASEAGFQSLSKEQEAQAMSAYGAYTEALKKAGALVSSNRLQPVATATTVHVDNGKTKVLTAPTRNPRSSSGATSSSMCPISMRHSPGRRAARGRATARSKCVRCG